MCFHCLAGGCNAVALLVAGSADVDGLMRSIILQVYLVYNSGMEDIAVIRKESYDALLARFHKLLAGKMLGIHILIAFCRLM